jgi:exosortase E/protease (VPEID-CTERM system)
MVTGTAAALAVAPSRWGTLLRRGWGVLLAGAAAGAGLWLAGQAGQMSWAALSRPTLWLAHRLTRLACPDVVCVPDELILGTPSFRVRVSPACSGCEGIGLVLAYLAGYLYLMRCALPFPKVLILLPIGAAVAWVANVVRVAALVVIGDRVSPELALGGFHSQAGWLAFNAVALGLVYAAHQMQGFSRGPVVGVERTDPTAAYLLPLLTLVAAGMVSTALFNDAPAAYPLRVAAVAVALYACWPAYTDPRCPPHAGWRGTGWPVFVGLAVFALWRTLEPLAPPPQTDPRKSLADLPPWAVTGWLIFRSVGSVVVVPLAEEIAFRGYLLRRLVDADFRGVSPGRFTWLAILGSSVLFGALHGRWLAGTLAGMAYAGAFYRRGRLGDAVLAHATTNGLLTALALTTGDWRVWS